MILIMFIFDVSNSEGTFKMLCVDSYSTTATFFCLCCVNHVFRLFREGCIEYRKVDSVLRSVEEEELG